VVLIHLASRLERRLLHWRPEHVGHESGV
jgi:hypothetical protein